MTLRLISFFAIDKIELPGLLYTPAQGKTNKVAIWLHGMGDNGIFYNPGRINSLGDALTSKGIALLAFNNRGAHNNKKLRYRDQELAELPDENQIYQGGTHYEKIIDCVHDIEGATAYLSDQSFTEFYLLGHSTGANKICAYHVRANTNPFSKYVLAGPGDDIGTSFSELGQKKFWQAISYAKKSVATKQPLKIMPHYTGMYPFSAQAAADILDPDGAYNTFPFYEFKNQRLGTKQLFEEYKKIDKPTLVIFGENDEYTYTAGGTESALKILQKFTQTKVLSQSKFEVVKYTDHGFHGAEQLFAEKVASWLAN